MLKKNQLSGLHQTSQGIHPRHYDWINFYGMQVSSLLKREYSITVKIAD